MFLTICCGLFTFWESVSPKQQDLSHSFISTDTPSHLNFLSSRPSIDNQAQQSVTAARQHDSKAQQQQLQNCTSVAGLPSHGHANTHTHTHTHTRMKQASTQAIMLLLLLLQVVMVMLTFTAAVPVRQQPRPRSSNSDRPNFVVIFADGELLPSFLYFFFFKPTTTLALLGLIASQ